MTRPVPLVAQDTQPEAVAITAAARAQIDALSTAAKPHEGCGFLLNKEGIIVEVRPTPNVHPEPATRFSVDPLHFLALDDELDGSELALAGIVHSHPFSAAVPSPTDRMHALPGLIYLIHGFPDETPPGELRAWRLAGPDDPFYELPLETH